VAASGGTIYRSLDDAQTWSVCTGATYTAGTEVNMNQNGSYLYITNGTESIIRYDGSTTLVVYTALTTPSAPSMGKTGLGGTTITYYYKCSAVNTVGFSLASSSASQAVDRFRDTWDSSNFVTVSITGVTGATRYDVYISQDNVTFNYLDSAIPASVGANASLVDNGTAVVNPVILEPTGNTTQGPRVAELTNVGSRQFGVRDTDNPYRIWFTSANPNFSGAFSTAYDGGYLNWQTGGKYRPVEVEDYRDGKGTPLATIWCESADGQGCVLQMSLDTLTIGDVSITVPSAYKLPGSRGTPAPHSVVNVLNDYFFYNSQAIYNLGSRAQFLNLLSTDEASANIRPNVQDISTTGESNIASAYYYARVYFSVPIGSTENNYTVVYDTERKAWLPTAFTIGFKKFLRYVDTGGVPRLLCLRPGDTALSEINEDIRGDYGVPFRTFLSTGLYPVTKDRFEFQWAEEGEFELSNPQGAITMDLLGIDRVNGYGIIKSKSFSVDTTTIGVGWDTFAWDTSVWDDTSTVPTTISEPSIKRYFNVQKEVNALQWNITTEALDARYVLRTLQTWGTATQADKPRSWRIN
jgi:hypothetical protein